MQNLREAQSSLVTANASWNLPEALTVNKSERIGLSIGDTPELNVRINEMVPNTIRSPAGTVRVSTHATAQLYANPDDAEITPSGSANASTQGDVGLLWTWIVTPKRPVGTLIATARLEIPVDGSVPLVTEIPLQIAVRKPISYVAWQIFKNFGTWSAIVAAAAAGAGWFVRNTKRKKKKQSSSHQEPPEPARSSDGDHGRAEPAPPPSGASTVPPDTS